jgi:hypothetical protein
VSRFGNAKFDDLKKFQEKLNKLNETEVNAFIEACAKELAARLLAKVIKRTPVGEYDKQVSFTANIPEQEVNFTTKSGKAVSFKAKAQEKQVSFKPSTGKKGGTLRRGWTAGKTSSASGYVDSLRVNHFGGTYVIEIVNPVDYASYVEFGHRTRNHKGWVKGKFMLTISEQELEASAPKILERKLEKKLGEVFK